MQMLITQTSQVKFVRFYAQIPKRDRRCRMSGMCYTIAQTS